MGHLELMLANGLDAESHDENLEGLEVAMHSGQLLLSIIQDILDLSKIEAGQLDLDQRPMSIKDMVDDTIKLANAYRIQRKNDRIKISATVDENIEDRIIGDQFRIQQGELDNCVVLVS